MSLRYVSHTPAAWLKVPAGWVLPCGLRPQCLPCSPGCARPPLRGACAGQARNAALCAAMLHRPTLRTTQRRPGTSRAAGTAGASRRVAALSHLSYTICHITFVLVSLYLYYYICIVMVFYQQFVAASVVTLA